MKEIVREAIEESERLHTIPSQPAETPLDLSPDLNDSLPIDLPDHFDDLIGDVSGSDVKTAQVVSGANIMTKDEYATFFRGGFKFARHMSGIKSLDITPQNEEAAKGAADAVYETIMDIPSLHWMLDKALFGKWGERAFAIAAFSIPMAMAVKEELSQRGPAPQNSPGYDWDAEQNEQEQHSTPRSPTPREPGEPDELAAATLTGGQ